MGRGKPPNVLRAKGIEKEEEEEEEEEEEVSLSKVIIRAINMTIPRFTAFVEQFVVIQVANEFLVFMEPESLSPC
jgi:hypothetical protein